jgi:tetratricopeptide (TPR) repeat protein
LQSKLAQLFLISLITLLFSQCVHAIYSKKYDVSLLTLVLTNPKEALAKSKEQLIQAEIAGDVEKQLIALFYSAHSLDVLTQFDEVDYIIEKGLALANKNGNIRFISEFTGYKAYQQEIKGDFRAAIINANKAHLYAIETGDDRLIGESLALRGGVQLAIENYDMAMKDIEGAIEIFKAYDDRMNLSIHYNSLAILYSDLGDSENALKYYKESVEYDELKAPYDQATILYNIGAEYAIKKDYKQAMEYYMKAMALSKLLGDKYILAFIHYGMAELMLLQNNLNEAEETLATVFNGFESAQDVMMLLNSYLLMA